MMCCFYDINVCLVKNTIFSFPRSLGGSLIHVRASSFMGHFSDDSWGSAPVVCGGGVCWTVEASGVADAELFGPSNVHFTWVDSLQCGFKHRNESSTLYSPLGWVSLPECPRLDFVLKTLSDPSCGQIHEILSRFASPLTAVSSHCLLLTGDKGSLSLWKAGSCEVSSSPYDVSFPLWDSVSALTFFVS